MNTFRRHQLADVGSSRPGLGARVRRHRQRHQVVGQGHVLRHPLPVLRAGHLLLQGRDTGWRCQRGRVHAEAQRLFFEY